jgi:hypothetical protein
VRCMLAGGPGAYRRLLAKLCLIREEVGAAAARAGLLDDPGSDYVAMQRQYQKLLNQGAAAFLKELLAVSDPQRRSTSFLPCSSTYRAHTPLNSALFYSSLSLYRCAST